MTTEEILRMYDPTRMWEYTLRQEQCLCGNAPTLEKIVIEHGISTAKVLIKAYIEHLLQWCRAAMAKDIIDDMALVVLTQYRKLKITEIMLFTMQIKAGMLGKFYKEVEPADITTKLHEFDLWAKEQRDTLDRQAYEEYRRCINNSEAEDCQFSEIIRSYNAKGEMTITWPR